MELKGSKTAANLAAAFAGESQARNKYTYYASKAKKDGFEQIAAIFTETAENEKEHAKIWFKLLHDGEIPTTVENLKDAAAGENYEWTDMYKTFAEEAREEGFTKIAALFEMVGPRRYLAVPQLRAHCHRQEGAGNLPGMLSSQGLFPGKTRELLIPPVVTASYKTVDSHNSFFCCGCSCIFPLV